MAIVTQPFSLLNIATSIIFNTRDIQQVHVTWIEQYHMVTAICQTLEGSKLNPTSCKMFTRDEIHTCSYQMSCACEGFFFARGKAWSDAVKNNTLLYSKFELATAYYRAVGKESK